MSEPVQIHIHLAPGHVVEAHSVDGKTKLRVLPKDHPDVAPDSPERMAAEDADCPHHGVSADTFRSSLLGEWSRLVNAPPTSVERRLLNVRKVLRRVRMERDSLRVQLAERDRRIDVLTFQLQLATGTARQR